TSLPRRRADCTAPARRRARTLSGEAVISSPGLPGRNRSGLPHTAQVAGTDRVGAPLATAQVIPGMPADQALARPHQLPVPNRSEVVGSAVNASAAATARSAEPEGCASRGEAALAVLVIGHGALDGSPEGGGVTGLAYVGEFMHDDVIHQGDRELHRCPVD